MKWGNLQPRFRENTKHSLSSTSTKTLQARMREDYNPKHNPKHNPINSPINNPKYTKLQAKKRKDANDAADPPAAPAVAAVPVDNVSHDSLKCNKFRPPLARA